MRLYIFLPVSAPETARRRAPRREREEKKLATEPRAICICSACASLILPLAACFVCHESEPYSCQSRAEQGGESRRRTPRKGGQESKEPVKAVGWWPAANLGFEWPVTSHCTATQKAASGGKTKKKTKWELERELWSSAYMCPVRGSPSWRGDGGRIDWRWWTINEGIDFRVRVAGWGLEINWNKHINTSSVLHPERTHTLPQIYYEPCLA